MHLNAQILPLLAMTTPQTATIVVLAVVLGIMIVVDFVLLHLFSKARHHKHELAQNSLSRQIAMHATIHEQNTLALRKQIEQLSIGGGFESAGAIGGSNVAGALSSGNVLYLDEDDEDKTLNYNKSFQAKLIQSSDAAKEWYSDLKNELLTYKNVTSSVSWKWESYRVKRQHLLKMVFRGKTLCLYMALDPKAYAERKIAVEDVSDVVSLVDTPAMIRVKNNRRAKQAMELIADLMAKFGVEKGEREAVDYYVPRTGTVSLIKQGLIKRVLRVKKERPSKKKKSESEAAVGVTPQAASEAAATQNEAVAGGESTTTQTAEQAPEKMQTASETQPADEAQAESVAEKTTDEISAHETTEQAASEKTADENPASAERETQGAEV